jgi:hypothetical protein
MAVGAVMAYRPAPVILERGCVEAHLYENKSDTIVICGKFADDPTITKED